MKPAYRHQIARIDRAILALVDERARMLADVAPKDSSESDPRGQVDDLLKRHVGRLDADSIRSLFAVIDSACRKEPS